MNALLRAALGRVLLQRSYRFSAAHCYRRPEWDAEENWRRFGPCSREPGHGHNYRLTLQLAGKVDPFTGFLVNLSELDAWVQEAVLARVDHHHLNHHVDEFRYGESIPSCENLVTWIVDQLLPVLPPEVLLVRATLEEDESLAATWEAPNSER